MNKICTICKKELTKEQFRKRTKSNDGLSSCCKECDKERDKKYYLSVNKTRKYAFAKERSIRNKEFVKDYLETNPCIDCGDTDWWNLEFDHREMKDKDYNVNLLMQNGGLDSLKAEISKCDVRCLKCHRKRTIHQLGWWRIIAFN